MIISALPEPYATIRGKISRSSNLVFRVHYGHQEVYRFQPYTGPRTLKQQQAMRRFGVVARLVTGALQQNGDYWRAAFKRAPKRFKTLRGFVFAMLYKSLFP